MKTLTRLFILLFVMAGVSSCYTGIPLKQGKSENTIGIMFRNIRVVFNLAVNWNWSNKKTTHSENSKSPNYIKRQPKEL